MKQPAKLQDVLCVPKGGRLRAYFTAENEVGCRSELTMLATMAPSF